MNRLGMLVDLSHVSADTMRDALEVSGGPGDLLPLLGPGGVRSSPERARRRAGAAARQRWGLHDHLRAGLRLAGRPGVAAGGRSGEHGPPGSTSATWRRWAQFVRPYRASKPTATLADVVAHCEHVREVAGIDHIGLGGDYDGVDALPEGLEDVAGYPRLLDALAEQGWSDDDLAKLGWQNITRVLGRGRDRGRRAARDRAARPWPPSSSWMVAPKAPRWPRERLAGGHRAAGRRRGARRGRRRGPDRAGRHHGERRAVPRAGAGRPGPAGDQSADPGDAAAAGGLRHRRG